MNGGSDLCPGELGVTAIRRGPRPSLVVAYGMLSAVVALDPHAQWAFVVFGPPLALIAWLDAMGTTSRHHSSQLKRGNTSAKAFDRRE